MNALVANALAMVAISTGSWETAPRHHRHHRPPPPPLQPALASWYDDSGTTASGRHYSYGYASLMFGSSWGYRVLFCHAGRCVTGQLDDHGPYVAGRAFDLSARLRAALACPDLCSLEWRAAR